MNRDIQQYRRKLEQQKGKRDQVQSDIEKTEKKINQLEIDLDNHEKAREVINEISMYVQKQLQYNISELTSLALEAVFDDPYQLVVEFVRRRNKTECDLYFDYNGNKIDPYLGGGGALDIASFALRLASWSMQRPQSRNVLLLDENFGNLSDGLQSKAGQMLSEISQKLGIQIIMVSHKKALIDSADRSFNVKLVDGVSQVEQLK